MATTWGQKVAFGFAVASVLAGTGCIVATRFVHVGIPHDPIQASLYASMLFFYSCAFVLYVIARSRLKGLLALPE